jgi:glucose/arabinose dehydrogenase
MKKFVFVTAFLFFKLSWCSSQITLIPFATGLSAPIDIKNAGDNRLFIVQQTGIIKIYDTTGTFVSDFLDISAKIISGGEQGLLGLAFDPNYATNGFFYVNYTAVGTWETHISRFKVSANPDVADTTETLLLTIYQPYSNHNGGHILFRQDGYLYIGMGDGGAGGDPYNRAQNLDSLLGKMLRIDVSDTSVAYKIPPTNPFYAGGGRGEIWDYGVRNPWRWSFDRWNDDLWIGDVGQNAYEEIDYEPAVNHGGVNYGWHCYEANHSYPVYDTTAFCVALSNYTLPVVEVPHALGVCAIIGGYVYRGAEFSNIWGKYFFSDECTAAIGLHSITHLGNNFYDSLALSHGGTFVSFGEDKYGELYIADYSGTVYKMQGISCSPNAVIHFTDTALDCYGTPLHFYTPQGRSFHYEWSLNGSPVSNSDSSGFTAITAGDYSVVTIDRNGCTAVSSVIHVTNALPPVVTISGADTLYCVYNSAITFNGNPAGGVFAGSGMTGNNFSPATAGLGYHTVIYSYTDSTTGCANADSIIIHVDACTGIGENEIIVSLNLFPNPNSGNFTLNMVVRNDAKLRAEVFDVVGKLISEKEISVSTGVNSIKLNYNLAKGAYRLKLGNGNVQTVRSFIVK